MVKATLTRHSTETPQSLRPRVSGSHHRTHSPTGMALQGQAPLAVCSPPASPVGSLSALHLLSALHRHPHQTCGELFSVRCSLGWLLPLSWPFSPPSLTPSINSGILLDCITKKVVCVRGGVCVCVSLFCVVRDRSPFSLEGEKGSQTDQHLSRW